MKRRSGKYSNYVQKNKITTWLETNPASNDEYLDLFLKECTKYIPNTPTDNALKRKHTQASNLIAKRAKILNTTNSPYHTKNHVGETSNAAILNRTPPESRISMDLWHNKERDILNGHPSVEEKRSKNEDGVISLVDKYRPFSVKNIIGQHGNGGNIHNLSEWLVEWSLCYNTERQTYEFNKKLNKCEGSFFNSVLITGSSATGKSTTTVLVCEDLKFDTFTINASEMRKGEFKKAFSNFLHHKSIYNYVHGVKSVMGKLMIIDEVDALLSRGDDSDIDELLSIAKSTRIPVIFIFNGIITLNLRLLASRCFIIKFNIPTIGSVRSVLMTICFREGIKVKSSKDINDVIMGTGVDIRQSLCQLSTYMTNDGAAVTSQMANRDTRFAKKNEDMVIYFFSIETNMNIFYFFSVKFRFCSSCIFN